MKELHTQEQYKMTIIYVLKCEKDNYYVGKTSRPLHTRITDHFKENGSEWTKRYPPINVVEVKEKADEFDEDKYTKMYMKKYGIDRVRGGTYTQLVLPDYLRMTLEKELCSAQDLCFRCNRSGHFVNHCYARTKADGSPLDDDDNNNTVREIETKAEVITKNRQPAIQETFPNIIMPASAREMRMFIKQKYTEIKKTHSRLTTIQSILHKLGEVWDENPHWNVPKPLYPDFLIGCKATWHAGLGAIFILHEGKVYCFPDKRAGLDGGVVQFSRNTEMSIEIDHIWAGGHSRAYIPYVIPIHVQTEAVHIPITITSNPVEIVSNPVPIHLHAPALALPLGYEKYGESFRNVVNSINTGNTRGFMSRLLNIGTTIVQEGIKITEQLINDNVKYNSKK